MTEFVHSTEPESTPNDVPRDRYGRYLLPDPHTGKEASWTRVSTVVKTLADTYGLNQWSQRMTVKGLADRPDLIAQAAAAHADDKKTLQAIATAAQEHAGSQKSSGLGTAIHAATEIVDRGGSLDDVDPELRDDVAAYQKALADYGIEILPEFIERRVILDGRPYAEYGTAGIAGTLDRIVRYDGALMIMDIKTGKDPLTYGAAEISAQLSCYACAPYFWDEKLNKYREMPEQLDRFNGLVVHVLPGTGQVQVIRIRLDLEPIRLAMQARAWRKSGKALWYVEELPVTLESQISTATDRKQLIKLRADAILNNEWSEELQSLAKQRLAVIEPTLV